MNEILQGDSLTILRTLPDESVNCCVTSPPYWGLRDYGTATWVGGDAECDHVETLNKHAGQRADRNQEGYKKQYKNTCAKCGAIRQDRQLGLEKTPEEYVANMVEVFREVRRVLTKDGTLWLNLGDSYYPHNGSRGNVHDGGDTLKRRDNKYQPAPRFNDCGLKGKDLVGIPWRVAFALQADGWWLRQDLIWHKPNPMPESVTDRCTKAHEYVFLMSKSARYYYDADAIKEPAVRAGDINNATEQHCEYAMHRCITVAEKRNKRSVWTVTTKPFKEAHFATFPRDLIRPMIQAGCPEGGVVLDPFMGAGTTALVAEKHNRQWIGIELNPEYIKIANERLAKAREQTDIFMENT